MKIKKVFSVAAVLIAVVAAFAFKSEATSKKSPNLVAWFQYEGPSTQTDAQIKDNANYFYRSGAGTCSGTGNVCAVQADYTGTLIDGINPSTFSAALQTKIANDRNDLVDHSEVTELP